MKWRNAMTKKIFILPMFVLLLPTATAFANDTVDADKVKVNAEQKEAIDKIVGDAVTQFTETDFNGDGKIQEKEYENQFGKLDFATKDKNNDGVLGVGELIGRANMRDQIAKAQGLESGADKGKQQGLKKAVKKALGQARKTVTGKDANGNKVGKKGGNSTGKAGGSGKVGGGNKGGGNKGGGGRGGKGGGGKGGGRK